jgi:hypothetical protein
LMVPAARATHGALIADAAGPAPLTLSTVRRDGVVRWLFSLIMTSSLGTSYFFSLAVPSETDVLWHLTAAI